MDVQYKIEYSDILHPSFDDKRRALVELLKYMKEAINSDTGLEQFVTLKRREGFDGKWKVVYKGSYE